MNKLYTPLLFLTISVGCSKDVLRDYEDRIIGSWRISDVDRQGLGGSTSNLPFREGTITFEEGRTLRYESATGTYEGTWDLVKKWDDEGEKRQTLHITAVDFAGQSVKGEYYDDLDFRSRNHLVATKHSGRHTYITHFRRR